MWNLAFRSRSALCLFCAAAAIATHAQNLGTLTTIYSFCPVSDDIECLDGGGSRALVQGTDGAFYGIGGAYPIGNGSVIRVDQENGNWTVNILWNFCQAETADCLDGAAPVGLIQGADGNFYGTTFQGGANSSGTVFQFSNQSGNWTVKTLWNFCSQQNVAFGCDDGYGASAPPVQGADGALYGTTSFGGANQPNGCFMCGTVFRVAQQDGTWQLTTLHSFCTQTGCTDGAFPVSALVQGTDGALYGTTTRGALGGGTVFKITPAGELTTLYSFCSQQNCSDGSSPEAALVQSTDGNVYGTTYWGGANDGGTVFKITPAGELTTLYNFCSQQNCSDGANPQAALRQAADGNFYGTTFGGGNENLNPQAGTVFSITSTGTLSTLYSFCSLPNGSNDCLDGSNPQVALIQDTSQLFYGTTPVGGEHLRGTIFSLSMAVDFTIAANPTTVVVSSPGQSGQALLTIAPLRGFDQKVEYSCANLPADSTCTFATVSATSETLTIQTKGPQSRLGDPVRQDRRLFEALLLPGFLGMMAMGGRRGISRRGWLLLFLILTILWLTACGGSSTTTPPTGGTPPGTTTVTVTATAGVLAHQTKITLIVQ
jgi:uncharacterized repeat protein (TIGR03803 family)